MFNGSRGILKPVFARDVRIYISTYEYYVRVRVMNGRAESELPRRYSWKPIPCQLRANAPCGLYLVATLALLRGGKQPCYLREVVR